MVKLSKFHFVPPRQCQNVWGDKGMLVTLDVAKLDRAHSLTDTPMIPSETVWDKRTHSSRIEPKVHAVLVFLDRGPVGTIAEGTVHGAELYSSPP
jgi:hypothetical protein